VTDVIIPPASWKYSFFANDLHLSLMTGPPVEANCVSSPDNKRRWDAQITTGYAFTDHPSVTVRGSDWHNRTDGYAHSSCSCDRRLL